MRKIKWRSNSILTKKVVKSHLRFPLRDNGFSLKYEPVDNWNKNWCHTQMGTPAYCVSWNSRIGYSDSSWKNNIWIQISVISCKLTQGHRSWEMAIISSPATTDRSTLFLSRDNSHIPTVFFHFYWSSILFLCVQDYSTCYWFWFSPAAHSAWHAIPPAPPWPSPSILSPAGES